MDEKRKKLIGLRIKKCRHNIGASQEKLAELLNMKRTNIANYEAGRIIPPGNVLLEMSKIFNVTTDYLLGLTDEPTSKIELDKNLMQIQRAKKRLSKENQKKMDDMLEIVKLSFIDAFNEDEEDDEDDL